ncbi:caspase family protein [Oscillatoria sp. FACHB-1406]|uniref:caspase family protein n=1 Tax=Oscillatoria sp. FACHB-1406 TaxID=2692846 RepID=UPI001683E054|nr:caspase family protein [Oscillatoria sp. FACHB-1406]MBD2576895.1 caspase family protein [Oscillatoria sp. FACHB-1406]
MGLTRRHFLQQAGFSLLALGTDLKPTNVPSKTSNSYLQALSTPRGRKLALLVGIDRYPFSKNLAGCLMDIELQRELLVGRLGFHRSDVLALSDRSATREAIETAFVEHLIEQAKEGDTVVFHFSGYGNRVKMPALTESESERWTNSLLPVDGLLPTKGEPANNELLWETLALLGRSLATRQVTFVLDTSYRQTGQLLHGNLRSRSPLVPVAESPSPQELAFQTQLKSNLKLSQTLHRSAATALLAAAESEAALEVQWDGFNAGLFTYTLVQSLWETTSPSTLYVTLERTHDRIRRITAQNPRALVPEPSEPLPPTYFVPAAEPMGAEGVVLSLEDNDTIVRLQLAGLPSNVLAYYQPNSRLLLDLRSPSETSDTPKTVSAPSLAIPIQVRSRVGLIAAAKVMNSTLPEGHSLQPGLLAREQIRILPRNVGLIVALAGDLERIERVDATSALSNVAGIASVGAAGEQMADCLFGKGGALNAVVSPPEGAANPVPSGRGYELLTIGRISLPNTLGAPGEAIASAVDRLKPKLHTLLAEKLWRLTLNEDSSRLEVRVQLMGTEPQAQPWLERSSRRSLRVPPPQVVPLNDREPQITVGTRLQYVIDNFSDRPVYFLLFGLNARKEPIALYSTKTIDNSSKPLPIAIEPGTPLTLPQNANTPWTVPDAVGITEFYAIVSIAPFSKTLEALAAVPDAPGTGEQLRKLPNPVEVARAVLQDLHDASTVPVDWVGTPTDVCALNVNAWATFDFVYEVVAAG